MAATLETPASASAPNSTELRRVLCNCAVCLGTGTPSPAKCGGCGGAGLVREGAEGGCEGRPGRRRLLRRRPCRDRGAAATLRPCGECKGAGVEEGSAREGGCARCRNGKVVECVKVVEECETMGGGEGELGGGGRRFLKKSYYPLVRKATQEEIQGIDVTKELHRVV